MGVPTDAVGGKDWGGSENESPGVFRILCIEDSESDFVLVREHLRDAGFPVRPELVHATTLQEALGLLGATGANGDRFDIILLDLSLPDSFGPETLEKVTALAADVPVIILSGNEDRELAVAMVHRGAQDYLPKHGLGGDLLLRSILYAQERQRSRLEMTALNARLKKASHDLKTAQMHLIQAEKLDSLGRLAAGVAHEVKNPLATLQMGVDFFRRREDEIGDTGATMVRHMQEAITSADTIIRGMVDYSRSDALELELRNINVVVRKALRMVQHEALKSNVKVRKELESPIPAVRIDQGKVEQVLINIMINSIQAMAEVEGERYLDVRTFWGQIEQIERDHGLRDYDRLRVQDHAVVIEVQDEGGGIPEDKLNRIFEPFYTTKATGMGTGLGLSVAKNIVDLHRGHIGITNTESPRGLRVRIFLKAYELTDK
ncbi:MAG: response regulator, partial [Verrucomicrobiae bacterium]|nr:response regulator [Verrucomicrobiae bacterium]